MITSPGADDQRVREAGLRELASDSGSAVVGPGDLVDVDAPAADQLAELSALDDRFDPALLALTLSHVLEAREEVSDGAAVRTRGHSGARYG